MTTAIPDAHSPAALARVELLVRTWLRADEASERAWDEATRAKHETIAALGTVGGSIELDGWRYTVMASATCNGATRTIDRRPVPAPKGKGGRP